jgi:hypothetical protein
MNADKTKNVGPSGGIKEPALAGYGCGKGGFQGQSAVEIGGPINEDVHGDSGADQRLVGGPLIVKRRGCGGGNDNEDVIVAVRAGIATGNGAEQVNPLGPIGCHEAPEHLEDNGIAGTRDGATWRVRSSETQF